MLIIVTARTADTISRSKNKMRRVHTYSAIVDSRLEATFGGFSMIWEFDKNSFLIKLDMVRSLEWTKETW